MKKFLITVVSVAILVGLALWVMMHYLKIDTAIASAITGATVSVLLTTVLGVLLLPFAERRKHKLIYEDSAHNEIMSNLTGIISSLEYVVGFNDYARNGEHIIPTHRHSLGRQLQLVSHYAEKLRLAIEGLPETQTALTRKLPDLHHTLIGTDGAAKRVEDNLSKNRIGEFKGRNKTALNGYLDKYKKIKEAYEGL